MSGYIPFPTTVPEAAAYLSDHYHMAVSEQKVRRVFDAIGEGLRAGPRGPRLILQEMLDRIMSTLEQEGYVPAAPLVEIRMTAAGEDVEFHVGLMTAERVAADDAEALRTPAASPAPCKPPTTPAEPPLSKPQDVVYSSVDERPQEKLGQQAQQPERSQPNHRGRRANRR